jgi:hypothetical protein
MHHKSESGVSSCDFSTALGEFREDWYIEDTFEYKEFPEDSSLYLFSQKEKRLASRSASFSLPIIIIYAYKHGGFT